MNRENKRKQYQKGYYKTHACDDSFTCRVCGRPVVPAGAVYCTLPDEADVHRHEAGGVPAVPTGAD